MTEETKEQVHKIAMESYHQGITDCCNTLREIISGSADSREFLKVKTILRLLDGMEVKK